MTFPQRPSDHLLIISKTVKHVVAVRFSVHVEAEHLAVSSVAYRVLSVFHDELVCTEFDFGMVSVLVLLDLCSAVDTVKHNNLLDVLDGVGLFLFPLGKPNTVITSIYAAIHTPSNPLFCATGFDSRSPGVHCIH